jgi:hypothetical protein
MTHTIPESGAQSRAASAQPRRPSKKRKCPFPLHLRRKQLARLVVRRHNRLPHDGWTYIKVAAEHCPYGPDRRDALLHWFVLVCAPVLSRRQADDILDRVPPRRWSADALGKHLRVTDAERATLRIYTIGSYQTPKAERVRLRKEKDRLAAHARRRRGGAKPREQCFSRTKPWEAFGIKRRAWERRGKPMLTTTQVRRQYSSLRPSDEFTSASTARGVEKADSRRKNTLRTSCTT